jgi:hypothetical protein
MKYTTIKEFLQNVKDILIKYGWTQGTYFRDKNGLPIGFIEEGNRGACCLSGATLLADDGSADNGHQIGCLVREQIMFNVGPYTTIPSYNDAPGRTQEEIISLLDKLIEEQT